MSDSNSPSPPLASPLATGLCRELFANDFILKLTVPFESAANHLEARCGLRDKAAEDLQRLRIETPENSAPPADSSRWIENLVERARSRILRDDENAESESSLRNLVNAPSLDYEFQLYDPDDFVAEVNHLTRLVSTAGTEPTLQLTKDLELLPSDAEFIPSTGSWIKVYPFFNGAIGMMSLARLWSIVRLPSVRSCRPESRIVLTDLHMRD